MAKDPAMLFYTSDFLTGVMLLSMKERGQYITLLCLQQQIGHMSLAQMKTAVGSISHAVLDKFRVDDDGLYFNVRADIEIQKRAEHCKKQRENISKRWGVPEATSGNTVEDTTVLPLENENETVNKREIVTTEERSNDKERGECEGGGPELAKVATAVMDKLGLLSTTAVAEMQTFYRQMGSAVLLHALDVSVDAGKRSWAYMRGILRGYSSRGTTDMDSIIAAEQEFDRGKRLKNGQSSVPKRPALTLAELDKLVDRI